MSTPDGETIRRHIDAQICPWCGAGPFQTLAGHTHRAHGIDRRELRDLAGVTFEDAICSPDVTAERVDTGRRRPPTGSSKGVPRKPTKEGARRLLEVRRANAAKLSTEDRMRGLEKAQIAAAAMRNAKTECRYGHLRTPENAYRRESDNAWMCRACARDRTAQYRRRRRERSEG